MTPLAPNYKANIGNLVTDRFDFQDHLDGTKFRHNATQIDLSPSVIIGGQSRTNTQDAIAALTAIVTAPLINDATTSVKGIIKLAGDIAGTATSILVTRLQGKPVSTLTPNNGDVLTWIGGSSTWTPTAPSNTFSPSGDLSGNNIIQQVVGLTGNAGSTRVSSNLITFVSTVAPGILQASTGLDHGSNFTVAAQGSTVNNKNGGNLILMGGNKGTGGLRGGVKLEMGDGYNLLQLSEPAVGRRVLSLLHPTSLTTTDMPANTGDMVVYVRNAATIPTSGNPSNGTILYSSAGQLWIKQQDGNNFAIGSLPNPNIWGLAGEQVYSIKVAIISNAGAPALALNYPLLDNTATKINVEFVGKLSGASTAAQYNFSVGYVRDSGGSPNRIGSTFTSTDPRNTSGASGWTLPTISVSGDNLQIFTGYSAGDDLSWLVVVRLTMISG